MTRATEDRITRYLDGSDDPATREAFEAEAADDPALRRLLIAGFRSRAAAETLAVDDDLLAEAHALGEAEARRGAGQSPRVWPLAAVFAVLVLGTALLPRLQPSVTPDPSPLRDGTPTTETGVITLLKPVAATDTIHFRWHPVAEALRYTVVIMDAEGTVLERSSTDKPSLVLGVPTSRMTPFYWFVEAHRQTGPTIASEVRRWPPTSDRGH